MTNFRGGFGRKEKEYRKGSWGRKSIATCVSKGREAKRGCRENQHGLPEGAEEKGSDSLI